MCVCIYVCVCVCMCMYMCMCVCMYVYVCVCVFFLCPTMRFDPAQVLSIIQILDATSKYKITSFFLCCADWLPQFLLVSGDSGTIILRNIMHIQWHFINTYAFVIRQVLCSVLCNAR